MKKTLINKLGKYIGETNNNLPDGFGEFIYLDGDKYFGEWKKWNIRWQGNI